MTRLAEIESHVASMKDLLDLVGAMRSLAGMRMQEARQMLPGIRRYASSVASGIADTLLLMGEPEPRGNAQGSLALVLFTAEHGFVGAFNEGLVEAALSALGPSDLLFILGSRGEALVRERGYSPAWSYRMATGCAGAIDAVQRLSAQLYGRIARGEIARVEMIGTRYPGGPASIARRLLLPLDLVCLRAKQPRQRPLHNLAPVALLEKLMSEYVFALLTEAAVESIACENAARLAAMESARDNVSKKLEQLRRDAAQARQSEITAELLELVTAVQALEGKRRAR